MRTGLICLLLGYCLVAVAGPGPFGLMIDKSRYQEISKQYALTYSKNVEVDKVDYSAYDVDNVKPFNFKGLDSATLYFEKKSGVLKCVVLNINTHRYMEIEDILSKKYRGVASENTPMTDKYAIFESDWTVIKLDAPLLNPFMRLIYINKSIYKTLTSVKPKTAKELKKEEAEQL